MADYEKRFRGFSQAEEAECIAELEAHAASHGPGALSTEDIEELLLLLPANYFKLLFRLRVREITQGKKDFPSVLADLSDAAEKLMEECRQLLDSEAEEDRDDMALIMDRLRLADPALWFRTYQKLRAHSLSMAIELEPSNKARPFEKP